MALLKDDYLKIVSDAGFNYRILSENKEISKKQYQGIPLESLKIEASKWKRENSADPPKESKNILRLLKLY